MQYSLTHVLLALVLVPVCKSLLNGTLKWYLRQVRAYKRRQQYKPAVQPFNTWWKRSSPAPSTHIANAKQQQQKVCSADPVFMPSVRPQPRWPVPTAVTACATAVPLLGRHRIEPQADGQRVTAPPLAG